MRFDALAFLMGIGLGGLGSPAVGETIYPNDDTFTDAGIPASPQDNNGLLVKCSPTRYGWIEFTLGSQPVQPATLYVYNYVDGTVPFVLRFKGNVYSFNEGSLTWDNQPDTGGWTHLGDRTMNDTAQWYSLDITDFYNDHLGQTVTISLKCASGSGYGAWFEDREESKTGQSSNRPRIDCTPEVEVPPIIEEVSPDPDSIEADTEYTRQLTLIQGTAPVTWSMVQGPAGLAVDSNGCVSGWTPDPGDAGQTFPITIQASNPYGSDTESWQVEVIAAALVGRYEIFQLDLTSTNSYGNPFSDTSVSATFTHTGGGTPVQVHGFHDGGTTWRVRFMPHLTGEWTYVTSSPDGQLNGRTGAISCVASANPGPLRTDGFHFFHDDGTPFFWNGDSEWFFLSHSFSQQQRLDAVAFLADKKVNNLLMIMVNDDTYDVYPWQGSSPGTVDYWRFNVSRLQQWEEIIAALKANVIMADLWFYSDDSSVFTSGIGAGTSKEDFYFNHMIDRFSAYSNVTWNLALEYSEYRTSSWVASRAAYVKNRDPYDHLIAVHEVNDSWDFYGNPNLDHTSLQRLGDSPAHLNSQVISQRSAAAGAGRPIPICHEEFFIEGTHGNIDQFRRGIWAITCAGGFYKAASLGWWIGTYYTSGQHFDLARHLFEFVTEGTAQNPGRVRWWQMTPNNSLVQQDRTRYALAKVAGGDSEYLIHSEGGASFWVNLSGAPGSLSVEWLDPRTGVVTPGGTVTGGGQPTFTTPSGDREMVLHIGTRQGPQTTPGPAANPDPPDQAAGVSITADLSWSAAAGATSYDVYFGTTNPPPLQGNQVQTTFDPGTMDPLTTYWWRIDAVNDVGTTTGELWNFTTGSVPGDFDADGDVDQEDFGHFQACLTGSGMPQSEPDCQDARLDDDEDVDQGDFGVFQACFSGPNMPADPGCTG